MRTSNRYRIVMAGAVVLVLLNGWLAARELGTLFAAEHWLTHTLEVITATEATYRDLVQANSAARAFLLTGDELFDARYRDESRTVFTAIDHIAGLTADNGSQLARLSFLRARVGVKLGALDTAISIRRGGAGKSIDPAILAPALAESPDNGPSAGYCIREVEAEEYRLLKQRVDGAQVARLKAAIAFGAASLLDLVLIVLAFRYLIQTQHDRERLAAGGAQIELLNGELRDLNADLEARVNQRTRELAVSNQELEAFSYSVSHDLRAPLRTIDGFSLALKEDFSHCLNEEGQDYINRVRNGVQRMGSLIDALLQLSRVTRSEVQRERVDLSSLVKLVFDELLAADPGRDVTLRTQPGVLAQADPRLMRIAFENLVGNASKYSSQTEHAEIEFGSDVRDGRTVYFIRDNGVGFDMQYVDRLFTAFQRLHGDREFKGSGIGLATVSRIVRRHHGSIWAEGEVGKGATFYFTLEA